MVRDKEFRQKFIYRTNCTAEILVEIVTDMVRLKIKNVIQNSKSCNVRINRQGFNKNFFSTKLAQKLHTKCTTGNNDGPIT